MSGAQEAAKGSPQAGVEVGLSDENPEVPPMDGLQGGFQPPSIEQLLSMVDTMEGLSDADREDLKQQLLQQQNMGVPAPEPSGLTSEALILLAALSLIIFIFVHKMSEHSNMISEEFDEEDVSNIASATIQRLEQSVAALQELSEDDKEKFRENVRKRVAEKLAAGLDSLHMFFGYKLYKSLKDKERKRDEKRRLKQQKKKK
ncbi:Uncharacterized protein GBIM_13213 [Gryllus bimaculatus]|nr:Uncharacterized protein GBIM_13213 [Gryllus bimaculatus]